MLFIEFPSCLIIFHHIWVHFSSNIPIIIRDSESSPLGRSQALSDKAQLWSKLEVSSQTNWDFKNSQVFSEWKCGWNVDGSKFSLKNHTHLPAIFGASPGHQATRAPSAAILVGRWAPGRVSCGALGARGHGTVGDWTAWPWHPGDCLWHFWWLKWASAWKRWCFFWSWRLDDSCWLDDLSQC